MVGLHSFNNAGINMPRIIIHRNGRYNIYSTFSDAPIFEHSVDRDELADFLSEEYGRKRYEEWMHKMIIATFTETSVNGSTIDDVVLTNIEGLSPDEFIEKYLN